MSKVLTVSTLAVLIAASTAANAGVRYVAADDSKESAVCVSSAVDRPLAFENKLEKAGFSYRLVANKLSCNGQDIVTFSTAAGNLKTAARLNGYSDRKGSVEIRQAAIDVVPLKGDIVIMVKGE